MNPETAGRLLWSLRRAREGAALCRARLIGSDSSAHDIDYYAWEAVRLLLIAKKVESAGLRRAAVEEARNALEARAPLLRDFRNAVTHPEDNRSADTVLRIAGSAVKLRPGMRVEYVLDPRGPVHTALERLADVTEDALRDLAPPDDGPLPRFDNSGRET